MIEIKKMTRKLKEQEAEDLFMDWGNVKEYLEKNWDIKGQLVIMDNF